MMAALAQTYDTQTRLNAANDNAAGDKRTTALSSVIPFPRRSTTFDAPRQMRELRVRKLGDQIFRYNGMNRPTGMSGTVDGAHRYDGHGRRVKSILRNADGRVIRYNMYSASGDLIFNVQIDQSAENDDYVSTYAKMDGQTVARIKSIGNPGINTYADEITYLHNDHLGSASVGTKLDGTQAWREDYSPFGVTMRNAAANDNQAGFTGHMKDSETGLNYMQARYYDPVIGRFLSVDPVTFMDLPEPGQFNRYAYTWNNPINATDPTGMVINCNEGVCEITADTYDPSRSNGQTTVMDWSDALTAMDEGHKVAVKSGDAEKLGFGMGLGVTEVGNATTASTSTTSTVTGGIPANADFVIHGHIDSGPHKSDGMVDDPSSNGGYGDTMSLSFANPKPNITVSNGQMGVHQIRNGQLEFRAPASAMTKSQRRKIQNNLNISQELFKTPIP